MRWVLSGRTVIVVSVSIALCVAVAACGGSSTSKSTPSAGTSTSAQSAPATSGSSSASSSTSSAATTSSTTTAATSSASTAASSSLWSLPNADADGTRSISSQINSSNVSQLKVAWRIPIVGVKSNSGVFGSTPVFGPNGIVYLQDLGDNVYAVNVKTGHVVWEYRVPSKDANFEGPNAVTLVDGTL